MKRQFALRSLLIITCLLLGLNLQAQVSKTVDVTTAGSLPTLITAEEKNQITDLTLTGYLNGTDIRYIREMAGRDVNGAATSGKLSVLDISGANIVKGGNSYFIDLHSSDNAINTYMFYHCSMFTSISIPNSVTAINNNAFSGCSGLTEILVSEANNRYSSVDGILFNKDKTNLIAFPNSKSTTSYAIPNSVTSIGDGAFEGCNGLTSITIGNSVTSIGENTFSGCSGLTEILVSEANNSYSSIDGILFNKDKTTLIEYSNSKSTSYNIPNSVTSIGEDAFSGCSGLTSITIPNNLTSIGSYAFYGCSGLTSITIPNGVTSIGGAAFYKCTGLTSVIIPNSVTSIGNETFSGCTRLTTVTIGNSVTSIGDWAFYRCTGLTSVTIGNSVTSIGLQSFSDCFVLMSITLPSSVTSIAHSAFWGCSRLTEILVSEENNSYCSIEGVLFSKDKANLITYPSYKSTTSYTIPHSVTSINLNAFQNSAGLTSVIIPRSVTSIGSGAFRNCSGLKVIHNNNSTPQTLGSSPFISVNLSKCTLYVPVGTSSVYKSSNGWKDFSNIIEEEITSVSDTIHVATAGTLPTLITAEKKDQINNLTLTGNLNGNDIRYLREMAGRDSLGNATSGQLFVLDLSGANIVSGGDLYYHSNGYYENDYNEASFYSADNSMGDNMFSLSRLTSISIPNSVTSIDSAAFFGCSGLTSVTIPNSVTLIGDRVFSGCSGLTSVAIGNSVTAIGDDAFNGCSGLISVTLPNSVTSIGDDAFSGCSGLTSVTIPNSVASIGDRAFEWCSGLASVAIGNSVTAIGDYAFSGCSGLTSVTIPNSVTSIGDGAFYSCRGLTSVTIPNSITSIGDDTFSYCSGLISITIPSGVTSIGSSAFLSCSGLTEIIVSEENTIYCSVDGVLFSKDKSTLITYPSSKSTTSYTIPHSVTSIDWRAFQNCTGLTSVTFPKILSDIGGLAFKGCTRLTAIHSNNTMPPSISDASFDGIDKTICTLYVPIGSYSTYATMDYWKDFTNIIEEEIASVSDTIHVATAGTLPSLITAEKKDQINNLTLTGDINGTDIRYIREMAGRDSLENATSGQLFVLDLSGANIVSGGDFYYHSNSYYENGYYEESFYSADNSMGDNIFRLSRLTSISIPNSVASIGKGAFEYCSRLTSVTIPNSVTSIDSAAFEYCFGLSSVIIGNSVTSIGDYAFSCCSGLTSVTIPNSVASIGDGAFYLCSGLASVAIGNSVTAIGDHAFYSCTGLTSITIPNSVTAIGDRAFSGCSGLTSVTIPNSVTSIGGGAFSCSELTEIIVSEENTNYCSVGGVLFSKDKSTLISYPNSKSSNYTIPNSVTLIGDDAFDDCSGLTSVTIPNSVTSIGAWAFSGCSGLTSVTIPNSVTSIGDGAFEWCSGLTSVTIPNSVASIGDGAFVWCSGLASVTIPNSVTLIGDCAFLSCTGLTSFTIPNSVISIGERAFSDCTGLIAIHSNNVTPPTTDYSFYGFDKTICTLYVPIGSSSAYATAPEWKDFTNIIEEDITSVPETDTWNISVYSDGEAIIIEGVEPGEQISVYSEAGTLVQSTNATGNELKIDVPAGHVYLIKTNGRVFKVAL